MSMLKVSVNAQDHIQGSSNALTTLVEYGDYECGFCRKAHPIIKRLQAYFGDDLRFVFRNFPLTEVHPHAEMAAEAAEYAATKGCFWEMHDLIYENQDVLSLETLFVPAQKLNLPPQALAKAIEQHAFNGKIKSDFLGGVRSGVNGTPTFFINNERYNGPCDFENLAAAIESMAAR